LLPLPGKRAKSCVKKEQRDFGPSLCCHTGRGKQLKIEMDLFFVGRKERKKSKGKRGTEIGDLKSEEQKILSRIGNNFKRENDDDHQRQKHIRRSTRTQTVMEKHETHI
jgi:hypothetical protein